MGQKMAKETSLENKADILVMCDIFSQGVVHASHRLKEYLGFEDPQSKFHPATDTLNEIFLVNFISFCVEKGVEERITTSKMTRQQSLLLGVDWIWTLSGADKKIKLQLAVQSLQMTDLPSQDQPFEFLGSKSERVLASELFWNKSRFEKLEEFCALVGQDCLGLFVIYGVPGKPKEVRGIVLDSIEKGKRQNLFSGDNALRQFILDTDNFLPTKEMLERCLFKKNELRDVGKVYINFL
ncbi:rab15 effector protein [Liasis olivaceus]